MLASKACRSVCARLVLAIVCGSLAGCGGSQASGTSDSGHDAKGGERRKEMLEYMKNNPEPAGRVPKALRNHP
jgi:hypothetical protein